MASNPKYFYRVTNTSGFTLGLWTTHKEAQSYIDDFNKDAKIEILVTQDASMEEAAQERRAGRIFGLSQAAKIALSYSQYANRQNYYDTAKRINQAILLEVVAAKQGKAPTPADLAEAAPFDGTAAVVKEIENERRRQFAEELHTLSSDDRLVFGELSNAAACYALEATFYNYYTNRYDEKQDTYFRAPAAWPPRWAKETWKPKDRRHNLIVAAALLVAEIERLDRAEERDEYNER